jgi:alcohol dehydrogenase (NADP+)
VNCLFVGAGAIADEYARGLSAGALSLAGVCDLDEKRATALADRYGCPGFTDLEAALTSVDADLVVNLTSHAAHAAVTRTALTADRHVYSQKPIALETEVASELLETARETGLGLACAPATPRAPAQQRARRVLADGQLGPVQLGYAHAHVGRVTDWHDRPESFLETGPLYDGGVYPLTLLTAWFGPVKRIRVADSLDIWPDREDQHPTAPSHVEAMLEFAAGPIVRLTASIYTPHRAREFYGLELHGDDGSMYLRGTGAMDDAVDAVSFGRVGREYITVPPQTPTGGREYLTAVEQFAARIESGEPPRASGRRGAHIVSICNAIENAAENGGPTKVNSHDLSAGQVNTPADPAARETTIPPATPTPTNHGGVTLPPVGFGCSRYRDGEYHNRVDSIMTALDAGYRLLDSAELYGNEHRIGELLAAPGSPDRDSVFIIGKPWRTNHHRQNLLNACTGSLEELGIDAFDCYMLHWPGAWAHRGQLTRLAEKSVPRQEELTFPEADDGTIETAEIPLTTAWEHMQHVVDRGLADSIGACNISLAQLETLLETGDVDPALVQVERHPYQPRDQLVSACHSQDIRVIAHSPLSAPGLLEESVLREIGHERDLSAAEVVIAWNTTRGVVPIPSSTTESHILGNLQGAATRLSSDECARIETLHNPDFER